MNARRPNPLDFMDKADIFVESVTGLKNKFIAAGWVEFHAEQMALESLRMWIAETEKETQMEKGKSK